MYVVGQEVLGYHIQQDKLTNHFFHDNLSAAPGILHNDVCNIFTLDSFHAIHATHIPLFASAATIPHTCVP